MRLELLKNQLDRLEVFSVEHRRKEKKMGGLKERLVLEDWRKRKFPRGLEDREIMFARRITFS